MNKVFVLLLVLSSSVLYAQSTISGYVNTEDSLSNKKRVVLVQLIKDNINSGSFSKIVASSTVNKKGYFHINKMLPESHLLYQIHVNGLDSLTSTKKFIFTNNDSIHFKLSTIPFSDYSTTNVVDKEWQKLNALKTKLNTKKFKEKKYLDEIRSYSKDSLQILAVKLLSIKELNAKKLLEKDILLNTVYYIGLLTELKVSDINPSEYAFLENKLATITKDKIETKYAISKWINIILGCLIFGLLAFVYSLKKNKNNSIATLSKQEVNIQNLILQGKSNKEIANELFISLSTVKTHITNIYQKLNISSRNELELKFKN